VKKYSKNITKIEELSILFLGVDSVSRSNMIRYMPETRKYLLQNMSAFELIGYNKVADNTFVNTILVIFFEYFFTLSAHLSSTFVLVGTKENTFV
jgi:hypothetical protein